MSQRRAVMLWYGTGNTNLTTSILSISVIKKTKTKTKKKKKGFTTSIPMLYL